MFCTNCGKEIIDTAKFCNFCGMPVKNMAASVPVMPTAEQPTPPVEPVQPTVQPEQTAPEYAESADISETESVAEASEITSEIPTAEPAPEYESAEELSGPDDSSIPMPNTIPTYGESAPIYPAPPAYPDAPVNAVPVTQEIKAETPPENKPERRYTFGHIMMCLAAVAVMAIVAGVFAGLYFSVV